MTEIDLGKIKKIHFIGIGGIGMSALARFFLHEKKQVSGSDRAPSAITEALESEGATIFTEQKATTISRDIEMVVYTEAMDHDHEEMVAAQALGVPMMNYFEALGLVANPYYLIAVAGTHGKTTTTAMLTDIFETASKDPTAIIGSLRATTKSNFRAGKSKYAIVEACEYKRDFLSLRPDILIITNIEFEHTDYYKDLADVQSAFRELVLQLNEGGVVVCNAKDPALAPVIAGVKHVVDYTECIDITMPLRQPGFHNRLNAAAAFAAAREEKIPEDIARRALIDFSGTWRRFEYKGQFQNAPVYDDYAHHPTELKATLQGLRELYPHKNIIAISELHTYSRTASLFDEFAKVTALADQFYFLPIYAAREENTSGVSVKELAVKSLEHNPHTSYVPTYEVMIETLKQTVTDKDVVIFMGAGNITKLAVELVA